MLCLWELFIQDNINKGWEGWSWLWSENYHLLCIRILPPSLSWSCFFPQQIQCQRIFFSLPALIQFISSLSNLSSSDWLVHFCACFTSAAHGNWTDTYPLLGYSLFERAAGKKTPKKPKNFTLFKSCPHINLEFAALPPSLASIAQMVLFLFGFFQE